MNALIALGARLVIGHRGNAAHAPENTLESFAQAVTLGADAIELDVRISRDGVPVVIHDPTLERTGGRRDLVASLRVRELRDVDVGATFSRDGGRTFPYRGRGLTIPTLESVLARFRAVPMIIEVKVAEAADATARALVEADVTDRVLVGSMRFDAVSPFRGAGFATSAASNEVLRLMPRAVFSRAPAALPYQALCIPRWYNGIPVPVAALARVSRAAGVVTHVWTVDDASVAQRLWRTGIQGIITNDPQVMIRARGEPSSATN
jgi:glycerophosphoryl diester phosphodiesterase